MLNAEVNFNVSNQTVATNPFLQTAHIYRQMSVRDCHYVSLHDVDGVAVKLSIKYSSGGSLFFSFSVSYRARRLERSFLCSQGANGVSCMRSHEFLGTVFND